MNIPIISTQTFTIVVTTVVTETKPPRPTEKPNHRAPSRERAPTRELMDAVWQTFQNSLGADGSLTRAEMQGSLRCTAEGQLRTGCVCGVCRGAVWLALEAVPYQPSRNRVSNHFYLGFTKVVYVMLYLLVYHHYSLVNEIMTRK